MNWRYTWAIGDIIINVGNPVNHNKYVYQRISYIVYLITTFYRLFNSLNSLKILDLF